MKLGSPDCTLAGCPNKQQKEGQALTPTTRIVSTLQHGLASRRSVDLVSLSISRCHLHHDLDATLVDSHSHLQKVGHTTSYY